MKKIIILFVLLFSLSAYADIIITKSNGNIEDVTIVEITDTEVIYKQDGQQKTIPYNEVEAILYDDGRYVTLPRKNQTETSVENNTSEKKDSFFLPYYTIRQKKKTISVGNNTPEENDSLSISNNKQKNTEKSTSIKEKDINNPVLSKNNSSAKKPNNGEQYDLAVYVTGIQNDQGIPMSTLTVIQNKTITMLTAEKIYHLIDRSGEFFKQIQNEQALQQSGEIADGQIAEIGAEYGAEKICLVSVTIIDNYLYVATRIVDVATKTSHESGDAEASNYNSIPVLTQTLENALNKMLGHKTQTTQKSTTATQETQKKESSKSPKEESKVENTIVYAPNTKAAFDVYKKQLIKEKGAFLDMNSMAYKEYQKYHRKVAAGSACVVLGACAFSAGLTVLSIGCSWLGYDDDLEDAYTFIIAGSVPLGVGLVFLIAGSAELGSRNKHLQKSYQYYINGEKQNATVSFYPYFGGYNTMGAGLTLRF